MPNDEPEVVALRRAPGRREEDPHGLFQYGWFRKLLVWAASASGTLVLAIGSYFFAERANVIARVEGLVVSGARIEERMGALEGRVSRDSADTRADLEEIKSAVLDVQDAVQGLDRAGARRARAAARRVAALQPDITNVLVCREGWDIWVPAAKAQMFLQQNRGATLGACP